MGAADKLAADRVVVLIAAVVAAGMLAALAVAIAVGRFAVLIAAADMLVE